MLLCCCCCSALIEMPHTPRVFRVEKMGGLYVIWCIVERAPTYTMSTFDAMRKWLIFRAFHVFVTKTIFLLFPSLSPSFLGGGVGGRFFLYVIDSRIISRRSSETSEGNGLWICETCIALLYILHSWFLLAFLFFCFFSCMDRKLQR